MTVPHEIVQQVTQSVLDRGSLSKAEIMEVWELDEVEYRELFRQLARRRGLTSGPHRIGGLRRVSGRSVEDADGAPQMGEFASSGWEEAAAERLSELLNFKTLEQLLGNLQYTLRQARLKESGEDRRGTKEELARALVVRAGIDLFAEPAVRAEVAAAVGVRSPGRWHPGKASAREFVLATGFPVQLAGLAAEESEPNFEYLEGRFRLEPLQPFQKEVQRGLLETLQEPRGRRCLVTLPTGGGKTRVAVESMAYWLVDRFDGERRAADHGVALWLAHTEELCAQAAACFRQVWQAHDNVCPLTLVRFWGGYTQNLLQHDGPLRSALGAATVLISTPHRLSNLIDGRTPGATEFLEQLERALGLIVIDEAHRAAAPMYARILARLAAGLEAPSVVGLTATPFRMEYSQDDPEAGTRELREVFHRLVEPTMLGENPRLALQRMGVLAEPIFEEVRTGTAIRIPGGVPDLPTEEQIEKIDRVLALRTDNTPRRFEALERILSIVRNPESSVLYFGPSVHDAECMAFLLRQRGIRATVVSGTTRDSSRRSVIQEFKRGTLQVLCNCEVLTTGFDAPRVSHVVVARPTISQVLYEQMVGRGLRGPKFGGTARCTIVNFRDEFRGEVPALGYERFRDLWYGGRIPVPPGGSPRRSDGQPPAAAEDRAPVLETTSAVPESELRTWPEFWEELLRWREMNGPLDRWEREVFEKVATYLRNGWPLDDRTVTVANRALDAASRRGFDGSSVRRDQEALF